MSLMQYDVQCFGLCQCVQTFYIFPAQAFYEMLQQFDDAGLDDNYPFGERQYDIDYMAETMHLDPVRVKWVKDHIAMGHGDGIQSKELYDFYVEWMRLAESIE